MEVAHIDAFRRDPAKFWGFYRPRLAMLGDVGAERTPTGHWPSSSGATCSRR